MKRFIYLLVALIALFVALPIYAHQYYAGVVGGLNIAGMDLNSDGLDRDISTRYLAGIGGVFGVSLSKNVSLQLEPMYLQKGGILEQYAPSPDLFIKSSFLEVPLFLKITFGENIRPYILAGPTVGFLLDSEVKGEISGLTFKADLKNILKRIDFGIGLGAGVRFPLGKGSAFLEGRYTFGLSNINKGGTVEFESGSIAITDEIEEHDELSTKGFQIMVGFTFPIGVK
jgi:hypothetical protein